MDKLPPSFWWSLPDVDFERLQVPETMRPTEEVIVSKRQAKGPRNAALGPLFFICVSDTCSQAFVIQREQGTYICRVGGEVHMVEGRTTVSRLRTRGEVPPELLGSDGVLGGHPHRPDPPG